jgi:predicted GIY-YIG superfamily endonuclease
MHDNPGTMKKYVVYVKKDRNNKLIAGVSSNMSSEIVRYENLNNGRNMNLNTKVVYYEIKDGIRSASAREKELKQLNRKQLASLVMSANPEILDLSSIWKEDDIVTAKDLKFII